MALNNERFAAPGGQRLTLLGDALHFLTEARAPGSIRVSAWQSGDTWA
jgi:hypothetical protein